MPTDSSAASGPGLLILAGAPLGNTGDASPRLLRALAGADVVAAEDTRRLGRLAADLGVTVGGRVVSFFEGNEAQRVPGLVEHLVEGATVLLITDGGMPSISDPGYRLVAAAVEAGIAVTAVPGPSAVTTALALSGLAVDRFCFEGFLPRTGGARSRRLAELAAEPRTSVLFESRHRLVATLADLAGVCGGDRPAAVCRELTKTYEQVRRGSLAELAAWATAQQVRGEITLVLAGALPVPVDLEPAVLAADVAEREAAGATRKEAIAQTAVAVGLPKRAVYDAVLAAKGR